MVCLKKKIIIVFEKISRNYKQENAANKIDKKKEKNSSP